ncbi:MAG: 2-deoxystreptamine glucosyltransferase [Calditrichaeota bacterium]|nr:2-deoxystreptamine glucosyltransferase [Calditrichota bacterium]
MRVLQLNTERTWRGGERQTLYTVEGLLAAGVEVGIVCREGSPLHGKLGALPVELHPVRSVAHAVSVTGRAGRGYDLLHAQSAKAQSIAVLAKPLHGRPVLYTRRVNFPACTPLSRLKHRLTDRVVANNSASRDTLARAGIHGVEVISSAVKPREPDVQRARSILAEANVPDGARIVGFVGDLVPQKGPLVMAETVRELAALRDDFILLQFGGGPMRDSVRITLAEAGVGDRVRLLGFRENVEDYYAIFDVFLVTGVETEGVNSSVYDAFVHGVPVVSTLAGGLRDSVGDRGLTCPARDGRCLADKLNRVLDDRELARRLADRAKRWALETVSIPAVTDRYLHVYRNMLAEDG